MSVPSNAWGWICLIVKILVAILPDIIEEVNNYGSKSVPALEK